MRRILLALMIVFACTAVYAQDGGLDATTTADAAISMLMFVGYKTISHATRVSLLQQHGKQINNKWHGSLEIVCNEKFTGFCRVIVGKIAEKGSEICKERDKTRQYIDDNMVVEKFTSLCDGP